MEFVWLVVGKVTRRQVHGNYAIWGYRRPNALSCSAPNALKMLLRTRAVADLGGVQMHPPLAANNVFLRT